MTEEDEVEIDEETGEVLGTGPDFSHLGLISERKVGDAKQLINDMLHQVETELEARGIREPVRPSGHPATLADMDITLLTNSEVASLYTQYVAYASYIGDELAKIEGLEEMAKKLLRDTLSELKDSLFAKGLKGAEATSAAAKSPVYKELDLEHAKLFFMKAIMKRRYRGYTSNAAALSRTIELRKLDFEGTRRDGNIGMGSRIKNPAPRGFGAPPASLPPPVKRSPVPSPYKKS